MRVVVRRLGRLASTAALWGRLVVAALVEERNHRTVHVAATVRLEDVDALVARIRDVAAAAARRSA